MAGLPEITITGTLVTDPELRFTPAAVAVTHFTVAANDRRYDKTRNEWVDAGATFLRCTLWRQAAENVSESLRKGTRVLLTGVLRQREWTTDAGDKRHAFDVDVAEIGPTLRFATATITKTTPTTNSPAGSAGHGEWSGGGEPPPF